jgi:hypothetical protein
MNFPLRRRVLGHGKCAPQRIARQMQTSAFDAKHCRN